MKKYFFALTIICAGNMITHAQTSASDDSNNDSIKSVDLKEVVVKADNAYIAKEKTVFIPSRRQKSTAAGGVQLLQNMTIPVISVNPVDNSVKTTWGDAVALYIDYLPATQEELKGLRTQDVKRVEFFDHPSDPRFQGAPYVVNFIPVKYEYGGYTKINAEQRVITSQGNYQINSKMAYKRMTYDLAASYGYANPSHSGSNGEALYRFDDMDVTRTWETTDHGKESHNAFTSLRAIYARNRTIISNTVGLQWDRTPQHSSTEEMGYSPKVYDGTKSTMNNKAHSFSPTWNGAYSFALPSQMSLNVNGSAYYSHNTSDYSYMVDQATSPGIHNDIEEDAWDIKGTVRLRKALGMQSLSVAMIGGASNNSMDYSGTSNSHSEISNHYIGAILSTDLNYRKLKLSAQVKFTYGQNKIEGRKYINRLPGYYINGGITFNNKNQLSFYSEYSTFGNSLSAKNPTLVYRNDIDAVQGNPALKNYRYMSGGIHYTWLPTHLLYVVPYIGFGNEHNPGVYMWAPSSEEGHPYLMTRSYVNSGSFTEWKFGAQFISQLLSQSLILRLTLQQSHFRQRGITNSDCSPFIANISADYYIGNFVLRGYYATAQRTMTVFNKKKLPHSYYVEATWGHGNWLASLRINNFFSSSWKGQSVMESSPVYQSDITYLRPDYHRSIAVTLTYSFGYGKKVKQGNEVGRSATTQSAVLK